MTQSILRVQLLGGFQFVSKGLPITGVHSARLQSLLTYLILHADTPQMRQYLAFQLWPDTSESLARNNLRQILFQLRHALPNSDRFLVIDTHTVCWKTNEEQDIDIVRFEATLKSAEIAEQRGDRKASLHWLKQCLAYYQGDLLPGCYDDWILAERERLRQRHRNACQMLMHALETQREYVEALQIAQRLQRLDPLDESAYESLLRLYALNEDRAGVQRTYQLAVDTLRRELDMEPGDALQMAYNRLRGAPRAARFSEDDGSANSYKLIGRQGEWRQLQSCWQRAFEGGAHFCLITGEPGIGKSRLAEELFQWGKRQGLTTAYTRSYGREGNLSLAPITEWLRSESLHPHLASLDPVWLTEIARLLPETLSEHPSVPRPEPITEYSMRQPFFEALARGVLSAPRPLLLWIDDLHWCDQETLEWLHFLLRFEPRAPFLLLGTARSEEIPPHHPLLALVRQLQADERVTVIELAPLNAAETAALAFQVQGQPLDDMTNSLLYQETEGNPLFVVETVRAGLHPASLPQTSAPQETTAAKAFRLPPRVQATIAGRLAQLSSTARSIVEIGAVMGRAFHLDLLLQVSQESEEITIDALDELWTRRIVRERSANVFDFTHDRLRDVAYSEISPPQRRMLHRRIAQALETLNAEAPDAISGQVAAHYEQAGLIEKAIPYYQCAGSVAAGVYANEDAIHLFTRGVELLEQLPGSVDRDALELNMQLALATLYRISKGWTSPEAERLLHQAALLSAKLGTVEQRLRALFGLQSLHVVQAQFEKVERTYAQAQSLFRQTQDRPPPFAEIYLVGSRLHRGYMAEARERFEEIVAVRDDRRILDLQESHGLNYQVHGLSWNSHGLWCLGYPQAAIHSAQTAIDYAREYAQPFNQALAITYLAMLQTWRAPSDALQACAEDACTLTREYKAPYYHAWAAILLHFARAEQQPDGNHLTPLRHAIDTFIATGARIRLPIFFSLLAQACLKAGRWEEGWDALEQAQAQSLHNDERWWDAEIHRLRGELMWAQGADPGDVEAEFQRALEIARTQQARSLELRAATGLARLWQAHSRRAEAKHFLAEIMVRFTEGFDTPDLQTAQALSAQL
jgi:DNA-binding SARP family transcriptional activator